MNDLIKGLMVASIVIILVGLIWSTAALMVEASPFAQGALMIGLGIVLFMIGVVLYDAKEG